MSVEGLMRAEAVTKQADVIAAITLEVLKGTTKAFDAGISDFNCHRANLISNDFEVFYSSAMEEKLQSGNLGGRPFGGTAIFSRKKIAGRVSLVNTSNPGITAICLHYMYTGYPDMLICSVYMPYNDRSTQQLGEYESTIRSLQAIINSHLGCSSLIGGDWNLDKSGRYPAESLVLQLCSVNNLCWLDPVSDTVDFTCHSDVNGHFSLIDHFLCSNFLADDSQVVNILVDGNNQIIMQLQRSYLCMTTVMEIQITTNPPVN